MDKERTTCLVPLLEKVEQNSDRKRNYKSGAK